MARPLFLCLVAICLALTPSLAQECGFLDLSMRSLGYVSDSSPTRSACQMPAPDNIVIDQLVIVRLENSFGAEVQLFNVTLSTPTVPSVISAVWSPSTGTFFVLDATNALLYQFDGEDGGRVNVLTISPNVLLNDGPPAFAFDGLRKQLVMLTRLGSLAVFAADSEVPSSQTNLPYLLQQSWLVLDEAAGVALAVVAKSGHTAVPLLLSFDYVHQKVLSLAPLPTGIPPLVTAHLSGSYLYGSSCLSSGKSPSSAVWALNSTYQIVTFGSAQLSAEQPVLLPASADAITIMDPQQPGLVSHVAIVDSQDNNIWAAQLTQWSGVSRGNSSVCFDNQFADLPRPNGWWAFATVVSLI
jgi:hypothetical protein